MAVSPRFCFFLSFSKSSKNPTAAKRIANASRKRCPNSPFFASIMPMPTDATVMPITNKRPPIVGVPSLDICQTGPSLFMLCPALIFLKYGTRYIPATTLTAAETANDNKTVIIGLTPYVLLFLGCKILSNDFPLVLMYLTRGNHLIVLVALARENYDIIGFRVGKRPSYSLRPVGYSLEGRLVTP